MAEEVACEFGWESEVGGITESRMALNFASREPSCCSTVDEIRDTRSACDM